MSGLNPARGEYTECQSRAERWEQRKRTCWISTDDGAVELVTTQTHRMVLEYKIQLFDKQ